MSISRNIARSRLLCKYGYNSNSIEALQTFYLFTFKSCLMVSLHAMHHYTQSSKNCFVPMGALYFVFLLIALFRNLFFCLKSSGKEPTQKETCRGAKFTANHYCEQDLSYSIMVVLQAKTLFIAPVIKI